MHAMIAAEDGAKLDREGVTDPAERHRLRMTELNSSDNMTQIDYMARLLDVSRADWSMAVETGSLALYDGILSGRVVSGDHASDFYFKEDFLFEMLRDLAPHDPQVAALFAVKPYAIQRRSGARLDLPRAIAGCALFADRARAEALPWPSLPAATPTVAYRCVHCHEPGGDGPPIPFDSPTRLRALLTARPDLVNEITARTPTDAAGRMPLDQEPLSVTDRDDLLGYIHDLVTGTDGEVATPSHVGPGTSQRD
jgi:hypothetical protein